MSYGDPPHDAKRYPGLALLKRYSVEYRNAWTSYKATAGSMPALLAGAWNPVWYEAREIYPHDNVIARAAALAGYGLYCLGTHAGMDAFWPAASNVSVPDHNDRAKDPHVALTKALRIFDEHEKSHPGRPAFLYIHLYATHQPLIYRSDAPYNAKGRPWTLALYENNVAYMDGNLRLFIEALDKRGKLNRGFFPASLIASAREDMRRELNALGHEVLMLDAEATRYGAVETPHEGEVYANFLRANRSKFGGVIVCLPNFGDMRQARSPRCKKPVCRSGFRLIRMNTIA